MVIVLLALGLLALGALFGLNVTIRINDDVRLGLGILLAVLIIAADAVGASMAYANTAANHSPGATAAFFMIVGAATATLGVSLGGAIGGAIMKRVSTSTPATSAGATAPAEPAAGTEPTDAAEPVTTNVETASDAAAGSTTGQPGGATLRRKP